MRSLLSKQYIPLIGFPTNIMGFLCLGKTINLHTRLPDRSHSVQVPLIGKDAVLFLKKELLHCIRCINKQ